MNPYTYTLVIKGNLNNNELNRLLSSKLPDHLSFNGVVARAANAETLAVVHVGEDSSQYGCAFARWLGELPFDAPYPDNTLLWYR